jgi:hypothetical protein
MQLLFVKQNALLSRLICWFLKEPVSHIAIHFHGLVIHSTHMGVHITFHHNFIKQYKVIEKYDFVTTKSFYEKLVRIEGKPYDFIALAFFVMRVVLNKMIGLKMPKHNSWNHANAYLCLELADLPETKDIDLTITTPHQVYLHLMSKKNI